MAVCLRFVEDAAARLMEREDIPTDVRQALKERLKYLRKESIRQSLKRLCSQWFPQSRAMWNAIDRAYALRSQLLHEGKFDDPDVDISSETVKITGILRAIYQAESGLTFRAPPMLVA
jgi:hypothetical protein